MARGGFSCQDVRAMSRYEEKQAMKIIQEKATDQGKEPVEQPRIPSFIFISVVVGGILTALFYVLVVQLIYRGTYVETIFTHRGPIPYMPTYITFVALTQLC